MELRANFASALALERSIKSRKKGKASLEKKNNTQDNEVHLTEGKIWLKKFFLKQNFSPHTLYDLMCNFFCKEKVYTLYSFDKAKHFSYSKHLLKV